MDDRQGVRIQQLLPSRVLQNASDLNRYLTAL